MWGYQNAHKEWSIDVYPTEADLAKLKDEGLGPRLKDKGNGEYISFKRKELKQDGSPNQPIRVVDSHGEDWNGAKIGNGSTVNVNFAINEYKPKQFSANILSMQVWDHVEYNGGEFPTKDDDNSEWAKDAE